MRIIFLSTIMLLGTKMALSQDNNVLKSITHLNLSRTGCNILSNHECIQSNGEMPVFNLTSLSSERQDNEMKINTNYLVKLKLNIIENHEASIPGQRLKRTGKLLTFSGAAIYALSWGIYSPPTLVL